MKKFFLIVLFLFSFGAGYFWRYEPAPFALSYKKAAINLPIIYTEHLADNTYALGEKYLAEDLAHELNKNGIEARLFTFEDTFSNPDFREGYEIYMRSGPEMKTKKYHGFFDNDRIAVLIETIPYKLSEIYNADIVLTGSKKKDAQYRKLGINSYYFPQFTRLDKFYPAEREEYRRKLLFVGNERAQGEIRRTVKYALKYGFELDIFGAKWEEVLSDEEMRLVKGVQIVNDELKYYYSSADIVFNDTRDDMIEAGFIANRIFDATAAGAFVISDYVPEIYEIYGDTIPMYKTGEEFEALVNYYLAHPKERKEKAMAAMKITREQFGAEKAVKRMVEIMENYRKEKGLSDE